MVGPRVESMSYTPETLQLLAPDGTRVDSEATEAYLPYVDALTEQQLREFYRTMTVIRRFDVEAGNLQRQGQLALWIPSIGQEAAQVGSGFAAKPHDHIFPAYREHAVGHIRGLDVVQIITMLPGRDRQLPPLHARDRLAGPARHGLCDGRAARRARRHGRS